MQKIIMPTEETKNFLEVFEMFVISQAAKGVADVTIRNYRYHMKNIGNYMELVRPFDDVTKRDIETMAAAMRNSGMAHNSIATYMRMLRTFYNWCNAEGFSTLAVPAFKEKETVKDTYTDVELALLLKRPAKDCDFGEFRSWVVVNFLMNSGCRSATVRCIQNQDVDLAALRVTYRHNKNSKIQVIPLCSMMANILREYMRIRKGAPEDYLFCDVYGGQLTEDALRHAIRRYHNHRGVKTASIHKYRHTFAKKYLMDCGGNAFTLQKLMGHSTLNMTKHYCRLFDNDVGKDYDLHSPLAQLQKTKARISK